MDEAEIQEWLESFDSVLRDSGPDAVTQILRRLRSHALISGVEIPFSARTPYVNTIPRNSRRHFQAIRKWNGG